MTSISALSSTSYQSPLQKLQDELQSEVNSGRDQFVRSGRAVFRAQRHQLLAAERPGGRFVRQHQFLARRPEVEDRQPDRQRGIERQADQRSGHRAAGRLQGRRSPRGAASRRRSGGPARRRCRRHGRRRACASWPSRRPWRSAAHRQIPPRPTAPAAPARPATSCSSSCRRCRARSRPRRRHPTARPAASDPGSSSSSFSALLINYQT